MRIEGNRTIGLSSPIKEALHAPNIGQTHSSIESTRKESFSVLAYLLTPILLIAKGVIIFFHWIFGKPAKETGAALLSWERASWVLQSMVEPSEKEVGVPQEWEKVVVVYKLGKLSKVIEIVKKGEGGPFLERAKQQFSRQEELRCCAFVLLKDGAVFFRRRVLVEGHSVMGTDTKTPKEVHLQPSQVADDQYLLEHAVPIWLDRYRFD